MNLSDLPVGTEVYNAGDMANEPKFGVITDTAVTEWGERIDIRYSDGSVSLGIHPCQFSEKYLGHHGTRFVTRAAYNDWRSEKMKAFHV